MKYDLNKYKFYQHKNKNGGMTIIAASTYAGKTVKGCAKCNPEDTFDLEKGKQLAAARCNLKIAEKRKKHASFKYMEALTASTKAKLRFEKMKEYFMDSVDAEDNAAEDIRNLLADLNKEEV